MLNIKPLTYYLSEDHTNLQELKQWISINKFIEPIKLNLNTLIKEIEQTKWLEKDIRKKLFQNFQNMIISYIIYITNTNPHTHFLEYITELDKHCFQGGYGYSVSYTTGSPDKQCPHHWMIKSEYYEQFKDIPEIIQLCATVCNLYLNIDDKPTHAIWN